MTVPIVICIPSKRKPPLKTLMYYNVPPEGYELFLISDPKVFDEHREYYGYDSHIQVLRGGTCVGQQIEKCYLLSAENGYEHFFRVDDDLEPKTFIMADKNKKPIYLSLWEAMGHALSALNMTGTTMAGFSNTSRLDWLGVGYKRTWGLIHGGAYVSVSSLYPQLYIDPRLTAWGDVYQTCAHRMMSHAVGRAAFIGFDKSKSTKESTISLDQETADFNKEIILSAFPDFVSCKGTRWIHNDTVEIANWRMRRDPGFYK